MSDNLDQEAQLVRAEQTLADMRQKWSAAEIERDQALDRLAAVTAERDALRAVREEQRQITFIAQAKLAASEAALRTYGRHTNDCRKEKTTGPRWEVSCTCGWTDFAKTALAEPRKPEEK